MKQGIYSSDSIPFADSGIPAVNFTRFGAQGAAYIHDRFDTLAFLSPEALEKTARENYVAQFGPLQQQDAAQDGGYTWVKGPWPWQYSEEV